AGGDRKVAVGEFEGFGEVGGVVAAGGGGVAREGEAGQRRQRHVRRAAEARLQHAAAPHRDPVGPAQVVDAAGLQVAAHPAGLDVDDGAGAEGDGGRRVLGRFDGLVEADGGAQFAGEAGVLDEVVVGERLFDEQQV